MPKPSPAKRNRVKKAARPLALKSKDKRKVVTTKPKANGPSVRKAAVSSRNSLTVPKRAQVSHSKRGQAVQPSLQIEVERA